MRHPYFHRAVMNAYDQILAPDHIPSYFLFLESEPSRIDVNIHPTKTEIKFEDEQSVFQIIKAAVRESLGKSNIVPSIDFNSEKGFDIPSPAKNSDVRPPEISINTGYNPFEIERDIVSGNKSGNSSHQKSKIRDWSKFYEGFSSGKDHPDSFNIPAEQDKKIFTSESISPVIFLQVKNRFILTTVKSGLMIIDQRRAHERIVYEKLVHSLAHNHSIAQQTLFPETIQLDPGDYSLLSEINDDMSAIGFNISFFGNGAIVVNGCPAEVRNPEPGALIESILEEYRNTQADIKKSAKEKMARCLAKTSATGYGISLNVTEMQNLTDQLFACENPNYTPSGKKILSIMSLDEIEKKLG